MSVSRRQFVQLMGAATTAFTPSPFSVIALDDSTYTNGLLHLSLRKPNHWFFASVLDIEMSLDDMKLSLDEIAAQELKGEMERPLVVASKYREPVLQLNPAISVYYYNFDKNDQTDLASIQLSYCLDILSCTNDGVWVVKPLNCSLLEKASIISTIQFKYETEYGLITPARVTCVSTLHGQGYLQFVLADASSGQDVARTEFEELVRNVDFNFPYR